MHFPAYPLGGSLGLSKMVRGAARLIGRYSSMELRGVGGTGYRDVSYIISAVLSPDEANEAK
jgi:hypothetical protein